MSFIFPFCFEDYKYSPSFAKNDTNNNKKKKKNKDYYEDDYGTEQIKISPEESQKIRRLKARATKSDFEITKNIQPYKTKKIIIDTDLGTDVDDAFAVLYALKLKEAEIMLITTNYGIPELRSKLVQKITEPYLNAHPNKPKFDIVPGAACPMGAHRTIFLYGNEGLPFFKSTNEKIFSSNTIEYITYQDQQKAAKAIAEMVKKYPYEITIVSIGIPTNIGLAIRNYKEITPLIKEIVIMGCGSFIPITNEYNNNEFKLKIEDFDGIKKATFEDLIKNGKIVQMYPNHNISGDTLATKYIFDSQIPIKIIAHEVTSKFWLKGEAIDFLKNKADKCDNKVSPNTCEEATGLLMNEWFSRRRQYGQCPHDPLTVHEAIFGGEDSYVNYMRGDVIIHEWAAFSTFIPNKEGRHLLGISSKNEDHFLHRLSDYIMMEDNI